MTVTNNVSALQLQQMWGGATCMRPLSVSPAARQVRAWLPASAAVASRPALPLMNLLLIPSFLGEWIDCMRG